LTETDTVHPEDADIRQEAQDAPAVTGRNRSLVFATATSGLARVVSVVLNAITIAIVVRVLGADGYGLWTTIISISSFLVFADFGLSNGLVAVIAEANGKRDRNAAIRAVSTTFFCAAGVRGSFLRACGRCRSTCSLGKTAQARTFPVSS